MTLVEQAIDTVFPACRIRVQQYGKIKLDLAAGWIDPTTKNHTVDKHTLFDLASVTKLFTTTVFLILAQRNQLALHTPLVELIPEFGAVSPRPIEGGQDPLNKERLSPIEEYANQNVDPSKITFFQLLTHSSGLAAWRDIYRQIAPIPPPPSMPIDLTHHERWQRALQLVYTYPFMAQPGEQYIYSDLGYILLGEAVCRLGGEDDLAVIIEREICKPLGLTHTMFNPIRNHQYKQSEIIPTEMDDTWRMRRVWGEVDDENANSMGGIAGHAGLFSSVQDITHFGEAWLRQDWRPYISHNMMQAATQEQFHHGGVRRGLGWLLPSTEYSPAGELISTNAFGHTGFTGTSLWIDPKRELVITVLTNYVYHGRTFEGIQAFRKNIHTHIIQELDSQ